jgi:hypothetical protein
MAVTTLRAATASLSTAATGRSGPQAPPVADDARSGTLKEFLLFALLGTDSRATSKLRPALTVAGRGFHGKLADLSGATVTTSPTAFASDGIPGPPTAGQRAFILDFGVPVSVLSLETGSASPITLVLPWLGTDFSPRSAYPASAPSPTPAPRPHPTGASSVGFTGIEATKLLVQVGGPPSSVADFTNQCRITTGTYPTNVRASLNGRLPFWTKAGPLRAAQNLTGLVEDLNALLATVDAPIDITLTLSTDTPGVFDIGFSPPADAIVHTASARWGGQATTDVSLAALTEETLAVPFPTASGKAWLVSEVSLDLAGAFPAWRAHAGQTSAQPGNLGFQVDAQSSVGRRIVLAEAGEVFGFALPVRPPARDTQLHLELHGDDAGAPDDGRPLATADVSFSPGPGSGDGDVLWREVVFASPVKVSPNAGVWLVLKAKTGALEWAGAAEPGSDGTATKLQTEGGRWEGYPFVDGGTPVAQVRVLRRPFPTENAALIDIRWGDQTGGTGADAGPSTASLALQRQPSPPLRVEPTGGTATIELSVTALASGSLSIKRVEATYAEVGQ